jgi:hypothetical protein
MGLTAACGRAGVHTRCRTTDLSRGEREEPSDWSQATGTPRRAGRRNYGSYGADYEEPPRRHPGTAWTRFPGTHAGSDRCNLSTRDSSPVKLCGLCSGAAARGLEVPLKEVHQG